MNANSNILWIETVWFAGVPDTDIKVKFSAG